METKPQAVTGESNASRDLKIEFNRVTAERDELLAACKAVVRMWERDFENQDTGFDDTPFHQCVKQAKSAIAAGAMLKAKEQ